MERVAPAPRLALASLLLCLGLSGCTSSQGAVAVTGARTVDASQALILPAPGGPAIVSVVEQRYANAVEQQVILSTSAATAGQNQMTVRMYGPMEWAQQGKNSLPYRSLLAADIGREVRSALPGVPMQTSGLFLRNNYGPFGYAFGRSTSGDACLYAWQQLRADESERSNFRNSGAIQVRVRLCESGASEKELLSVMYGYTLTGSFASDQWNPYGSPKDVDAAIGADGNPIYPRDVELSSAVKVASPRPVIRRAASTSQVEQHAAEQQDENAAKRVVDVPSPSGESDAVQQSDTSTGAKVVVPGPGCENGNAECN